MNTVEEAETIVKASRYYPLGQRGYFPIGRVNHFGYDMPTAEYLERANEELIVFGDIEQVEGLRQLDELVMVKGLDVIWVGSGDICQSMGFPGQQDHPEVVEAMDKAVIKICKGGKIAGASCVQRLVPHYMELGALVFHAPLSRLLSVGGWDYLGHRRAEADAMSKAKKK